MKEKVDDVRGGINGFAGKRLSWLAQEVINRLEKVSECVQDLVSIFIVFPI